MRTLNKTVIVSILAIASGVSVKAQEGFGTNNPAPSSVVDMVSGTKGVLLPRVALISTTDASPVSAPAEALTVFNTRTTGDVTPGYYYWSVNKWVRLLDDPAVLAIEPWQVESTTTKANLNTQNIYQNANVGIGDFTAENPIAKLDVRGAVRGGTDNTGTIGSNSATFGTNNQASGSNAFAVGGNNIASGNYSVALGNGNTTSGSNFSIALGRENIVSGDAAAIGYNNNVAGNFAMAIGQNNQLPLGSNYALGIGSSNTISGLYAIGIGRNNTSSGEYAYTLGSGNTSSGIYSLTTGADNISSGSYAMALGSENVSSGDYTLTVGQGLTSASNFDIALGRYNAITTGTPTSWVPTDPLLQLGVGADGSSRANALTILKNGNIGTDLAIAPTERFDVGSGNVRVRDINTITGLATDKVVVADGTGILKTVDASVIAPAPIITTITDTISGHRIANYTNESATVTAINETVTALSYDGTNRQLQFKDENGATTNFNMIDLIGSSQTLTSLSVNSTANTLDYFDENGVTSNLNLSSLIEEPWYSSDTNTGATLNTENIYTNGWVGIGYNTPSDAPDEKLRVNGAISTVNAYYADYVFEDYFKGSSLLKADYKFMTLPEVDSFIKTNQHLPGITPITALTKSDNGYAINISELSVQLLEKTEELYLHVIQQNKQIEAKDFEIQALKKASEEAKQVAKTLEERLEKLEKLMDKQ